MKITAKKQYDKRGDTIDYSRSEFHYKIFQSNISLIWKGRGREEGKDGRKVKKNTPLKSILNMIRSK